MRGRVGRRLGTAADQGRLRRSGSGDNPAARLRLLHGGHLAHHQGIEEKRRSGAEELAPEDLIDPQNRKRRCNVRATEDALSAECVP